MRSKRAYEKGRCIAHGWHQGILLARELPAPVVHDTRQEAFREVCLLLACEVA